MGLTFRISISEFQKLVSRSTYRVAFHIRLFIWSERGLLQEECAGKKERGRFLVEMWEQQLFECWAWRSMGNVSSCWQSISQAVGQWEKQRSKQVAQTNAWERVGRGQAEKRDTSQHKEWNRANWGKGKGQLKNKGEGIENMNTTALNFSTYHCTCPSKKKN